MKPATLLKEPGKKLRIAFRCSLLVVGPDPGRVGLNVPLDRKAGQRFRQITPNLRRGASWLLTLLFSGGVEATIGAVAREARSITVLTRDDGLFQSTLCWNERVFFFKSMMKEPDMLLMASCTGVTQ